jgi:hypothetical protein
MELTDVEWMAAEVVQQREAEPQDLPQAQRSRQPPGTPRTGKLRAGSFLGTRRRTSGSPSGLAHPAYRPGCPDEADPDGSLKLSARHLARADRRPNCALQREVLDVQRGNPAICVMFLARLRPQLLSTQLARRLALISQYSPPSQKFRYRRP